jgi:hypothetical protein
MNIGQVPAFPQKPYMWHHKMTEKQQGYADGWNALRDRLKNEPLNLWIPVSDRLPEESLMVVARMRNDTFELAWATYWHGASNAFHEWQFQNSDVHGSPTHWMAIPAFEEDDDANL